MAIKLHHITLAILLILLGTLLVTNNSSNKITGLATNVINDSVDKVLDLNISNFTEIKSLSLSGNVLEKGDVEIYLNYGNKSLLIVNETNFSGFINKSSLETTNISIKDKDLKLAFYLKNTTFKLSKIEYKFAKNSSN